MTRSTMLAVYAMAFGNFAAGMSALVLAGVLTEMAADLGVSAGQAGQLISIYSFSYALGAPLIMLFTTRHQRRLMLAGAMALLLVGNGGAALSSNYFVIFALRIVTAVGGAAFVPLAAASAFSLAPPDQSGRISAIVFMGFSLATALGLPIGAWVGLNYGWRWSLVLIAAMASIAGVLLLRLLPHDLDTPPVNAGVFRRAFANRLLIVVLSVTILQFAGQMAVFAYVSPWLNAFTDLEATGITLVLLVSGVGGVTGNLAGGVMTDRFGARATQLVQLIALALTMAMLPLITANLWIGVALIFVWGFVGQGFIAPQIVRLVGIDQSLSSASLSLNSSFINIGVTLGSVAGGYFLEEVGVASLTWLGVTGTVLSMGVFALSWVMENGATRTATATSG